MNPMAEVLVEGSWRASRSVGEFQAENPATGELLPERYPVSSRDEMLAALGAGREAAEALRTTSAAAIGDFLEAYARGIEAQRESLVDLAHRETGLPRAPRLNDVELPRTTGQLRLAAAAVRSGAWRRPIIDVERNIRSVLAPLGGAVVVMGPNNFPFAFNSVSGGDFAAAIAAHNPVIAKANPGHPGTTGVLARIASEAVRGAGLHPATVQLLFHLQNELGLDLVSHRLTGATAFTGSQGAGLKLKAAADAAGRPIFLEMSSINPVVLLPGALAERAEVLAEEFFTSCTMGAGQFCTNPGMVIVPDSPDGARFVDLATQRFAQAPGGVLLGGSGQDRLRSSVATLREAGATLLCGGDVIAGPGYRFANTLLRVSGDDFLRNPAKLQAEAFGPVSLFVVSKDVAQTIAILEHLEGNLTGTVYSDSRHWDDDDYNRIEPYLRRQVGRLLNNRMPTGVAVSAAMNHGGPFPSTGNPVFTAVGIPTSIERFTKLQCYENVRSDRLPDCLR